MGKITGFMDYKRKDCKREDRSGKGQRDYL